MTTPQVEDGYTKIANELLDAIVRAPLSKRQYKVLLLLVRKTYGFNKKTDDLTVTQVANGTGLTRPHASSTISELVAMKCVLKRDGRHGYVLGINKNYREWQPSQNGTCPETGTTPSRNGTQTVPKRDIQKTTPKETTKRKRGAFAPPSLQEVVTYCQERRNQVDPERWYDFYASKGWMIGKTRMKDWQAAVRTWERREQSQAQALPYGAGGF